MDPIDDIFEYEGDPPFHSLSATEELEFSEYLVKNKIIDESISSFVGDETLWELAVRTHFKQDEPRHRYIGAINYAIYQKEVLINPKYKDAITLHTRYCTLIRTNCLTLEEKVTWEKQQREDKKAGRKNKKKPYDKPWFDKFLTGKPYKNYEEKFRKIKMHEGLVVDENWFYNDGPSLGTIPDWLQPYCSAISSCNQFIRNNLSIYDENVLDFESKLSLWVKYIIKEHSQSPYVDKYMKYFKYSYPEISNYIKTNINVPMSLFTIDSAMDVINHYLNYPYGIKEGENVELMGDVMGYDYYSEENKKHLLRFIMAKLEVARFGWMAADIRRWQGEARIQYLSKKEWELKMAKIKEKDLD
jgi:hypothetical protein